VQEGVTTIEEVLSVTTCMNWRRLPRSRARPGPSLRRPRRGLRPEALKTSAAAYRPNSHAAVLYKAIQREGAIVEGSSTPAAAMRPAPAGGSRAETHPARRGRQWLRLGQAAGGAKPAERAYRRKRTPARTAQSGAGGHVVPAQAAHVWRVGKDLGADVGKFHPAAVESAGRRVPFSRRW